MNFEAMNEIIRKNDIQCVLVGTPDVNGNFRGRGVRTDHFLKGICSEGLGVCDCIYIMDTLDQMPEPTRELPWYPDWEGGYRDYMIRPDFETFSIVPWLDRTAMIIGDVYDQTTGQLLETSPRSLLKRLVAKVSAMGYQIQAATELEFIIFPESIQEIAEKGFVDIKTLSPGCYDYSIYRISVHQELIEKIVRHMNLRGVPVHTYQVEAGPGQFEFQILHSEILRAADNAAIYKSGLKEIVAREGMTASFMAKYDPQGFGSSCHLHQSLLDKDTGRNLFWDPSRDHNISAVMAHYAAGLLEVMPALTLMWAPFVNSYKRYGKGTAAGMNQTWGIDNRTVGVRVLAESESACRLEHRAPGADSNPYLVMAAMLAGGLYGLENKVNPPELVVGNAYKLPDSEAGRIPQTMGDAIQTFAASDVARQYFGEKFVEYYAEFKQAEWNEFCSWVTDWEKRKYLEMV